MPVCCVCEADGVLIVDQLWYCSEHLDEAIMAVITFTANAHGWDPEYVEGIRAWLTE